MKKLVIFLLLISGFFLTACQQQIQKSLPVENNTTSSEEIKTSTKSVSNLTQEEAVKIASKSNCLDEGELTNVINYNDYTKTWWIDMKVAGKEGCAPACVVKEEDLSAEINWRCTGLNY